MRIATAHLLLNWGVLVVLVAAVLVVRHRSEGQARAPLPPPKVHLSAAQARQWQAFPSYRRIVPVLMYHGVDSADGALSIRTQFFALEMLALKTAGFHAITLDQYISYVNGHRRGLPSKPILLTFDGGRLDTYRAVNNILREYGFHATVFTFAAWPVTNPGFSLTWSELRNMRESGIWSVQEHGGHGREYVIYNAAGGRGGVYAFRRYIRSLSGQGHLESFSSFVARTTSSILWGEHQFAVHIPRYRPLAFAIPEANYGQQQTNDPRIPEFVLPWLRQHFKVVFGGDYLDRGRSRPPHEIRPRFSPTFSYRISVNSKTSLPALNCRLRHWVARTPIWKEYRCLRPGTAREPRMPSPPMPPGGRR